MAEVLLCTGRLLQPAQLPLEVAGTIVTLPLGGSMGMVGRAARAGQVALDANALIPLLEQSGSAAAGAVRTAMAGRAPVVSIQVAKEFLRGGGDVEALRSFLQASGGRVGAAATSTLVKALEKIGLREGDARAVGSAIREGIEFLTRDKRVLNKGIPNVRPF